MIEPDPPAPSSRPTDPASRSAVVDARIKSRRARRFAGLSCGGLLVLVLSGGGVLALGHVLLRPAALQAVDAGPIHRPDQRMIGRWVAKDGTRVLISKSGAIWADNGNLLGEGVFDALDDTRLTFSGPGFRCVYKVTFKEETFTWT